MFSKTQAALLALSILASSSEVFGRMRVLERDNRPVYIASRSFDHQNPAVLTRLSQACPGGLCGTLSGQAVSPLLAAADECAQQDMADKIIDAAQQFDDATKANMIAIAVEYRQAERNTPPDFSQNPPVGRNSLFCQKSPKNAELNGLVQAQDPSNDPNAFFDPATSSTIKKGTRPDTFPFGTSGTSSSSVATSSGTTSTAAATSSAVLAALPVTSTSGTETSSASRTTDTSPCESVVTVTVTASATDAASAIDATSTATTAATATTTASSAAIGNFGSCSVPQIIFQAGLDNRKETAFEPADLKSYPHGSAQAIGIIAQFICDTLTNSCGADQTAKATCATAQQAANGGTAKTGEQADVFNAVFGVTTHFADVVALDDNGNPIAGTGSEENQDALTNGPADFGKCSAPQIKFATGLDGRKETAFEPVDLTSYPHTSAQNIDIIAQFICDTLTNSCGADAAAKTQCAAAQAAADAQTAKTGAQADAFNNVFGIKTDFASVPAIDEQGNVIAIAGSTAAAASTTATSIASSATAVASSNAAATTTSSTAATTSSIAAATSTAAAAATSGQNLQTFIGALGGVTAPAVTKLSDGEFQVDGNASFQTLQNALERSCDVQHNQCANKANASGNKGDFTVAACGTQQEKCAAAANQ